MSENKTELIIYQTEDGQTKIDVHMENETVWLSLDQMAELFQRDKSTISRHIKNIFDEGELQFVTVIPMGSNDVTRDLATILAATPELAEEVKLRYADCQFAEGKDVTIKHRNDEYVFTRKDINEVVEARLDEIFEEVHNRLKAVGYDRRLPEGLVLVGGGARMKNLDIYVRAKLGMAVRIGEILPIITSSAPEVLKVDYATAIGLMMRDMGEREFNDVGRGKRGRGGGKIRKGGPGILAKISKLFH
jgi:cell division ATPase FtsA